MNRFWGVVFLFFCVAVSLKAHSTSNKVNLIIVSDPKIAPDAIMGRYIRKVENLREGDVLYYRVHSMKELLKVLNQPSSLKIQSISFMGIHGYRYDNIMEFALTDRNGGQPLFTINELKNKVNLNFTDDAVVIFDSCEIMPKEMNTEAKDSFLLIADALGMSSGSIYGNYTVGSNATEILLGTPFYDSNSREEVIGKLAAQAIWPITLVYYSYLDRIKNNQGYLFSFDNKSHFYQLQNAHMYDVQNKE